MKRFCTANIEEGARPIGSGLPKPRSKKQVAPDKPETAPGTSVSTVAAATEDVRSHKAADDACPASSSAPSYESIDGAWSGGVITGSELVTDDELKRFQWIYRTNGVDIGPSAEFIEKTSTMVKLKLGNEFFTGELQADGRLCWSDGEVWTRSKVAAAVEGAMDAVSNEDCDQRSPGLRAKRAGCKLTYKCVAVHRRKETWGRSKLGSSRSDNCRAFEKEHPPICAKQLAREAIERAEKDGEAVESMFREYEADAAVQAKVLLSLGIRTDKVLGQRALVPEDIPDMLCVRNETLARKLFRKNSFEDSLKPAAVALSKSGMWPAIMSRRMQAHVTEIPTLELCAAICTRILCVARRLRNAGNRSLIVLGVGSGDALVEASIALHLGQVLGQQVALSRLPVTFTYEGDFKIIFIATDTPNQAKRIEGRSSEVLAQMSVQPYEVQDVVEDFVKESVPMYVFASWTPEKQNWLKIIEDVGGSWVEEICFLQPPPGLRQLKPSDFVSEKMRTTELFPKTLCRQDFLSHGFEAGPEITFYHSQLYVWTPREVPRPYLAKQLEHTWGSFAKRMESNKALEGLHYFHRVGLSYARSPDDLSIRLPDKILDGMKDLLYQTMQGHQVADLRKWLREALRFAEGHAKKQLDLLINNSAYRMYTSENDKKGKDLVASMNPALASILGAGKAPQQRMIGTGLTSNSMEAMRHLSSMRRS